jgi:hypothetical protein
MLIIPLDVSYTTSPGVLLTTPLVVSYKTPSFEMLVTPLVGSPGVVTTPLAVSLYG